MWEAQCRAFRDTYGSFATISEHGRRELPGQSMSTFDELSDDLEALCAHLEIERAVVIGISLGGVTALRLAQRFPERVGWGRGMRLPVVLAGHFDDGVDERIRIANESGMAGLAASTIARWFRPAFIDRNGPGLDEVRRMIAGTLSTASFPVLAPFSPSTCRPFLASWRRPASSSETETACCRP